MPDWINNLLWLLIGAFMGMMVFLIIVVVTLEHGKEPGGQDEG